MLAKKTNGNGELLNVQESAREKGRKDIHAGKVRFVDWVKQQGGAIDIGIFPYFCFLYLVWNYANFIVDSLHPFTRWITPTNIPKRFTTQMYIYFLPLSQSSNTSIASETVIPVPTSDGGLEHTAALFAPCSTWLSQATSNEIILFPPQFYLMHLLAPFLPAPSPPRKLSSSELQAQRDQVLKFLQGDGDGKGIPWADKVMSPIGLMMSKKDGRSVLALDKPGPELKGSGRGGDEKRVVLVRFSKEGPRDVDVRERSDVLVEERRLSEAEKSKI